MKQQHQIRKIISIILLSLLTGSFIYADPPSKPTPASSEGTVFKTTETPVPDTRNEPTPTNPDYQMNGDVNMDNRIDIIDALLISQYYVGLDPENFKNPAVANVNGDDKIDIIDALLVAQYYVGIISGFYV